MKKNQWYYAYVSDGEMFTSPCVVNWDGEKYNTIYIYKEETEDAEFHFNENGYDDSNGYSIDNALDLTYPANKVELFTLIFDEE